ncbi:MAG: bifunctional response regulator/alkaline phosphatase family protein [Candidatus Cloacimonetes bacterium]|nr:bifunctional response regulator/alkaline phosphatase family protein [Candidatus Cloacimonadota bacterium]
MAKQIKILWVDDEIDLLKPFILFLREKGYFVDSVSNGNDALVKIKIEDYDLILLDEMMPGLDGLTTLKEIKKFKSSLPIVMVTKNEEEGLMEKAIAGQIADYIIKPINPNQIIMSIKKIFKTEEIIYNKAGQEYSIFISKLNSRLSDVNNWEDWTEIYKDICKWDIIIDNLNDTALKQTHFLQKRNCNTEFCNYVEKNYINWLREEERPILSFDLVSNYLIPHLETEGTTYFLILDCLRLDQFYSLEPFIKEYFDIDLDIYYSILPTATPYSRNSIFSGLLPIDIADRFPEYWIDSHEMDNSRNRNEHQLLDEHIEDLGFKINPPSKYVKVFNIEEGNFVLRKIDSFKNEKLVVLVYNFLDLLAHHRSKDQILQETIPDEEAFRDFTKHWFQHSSLFETIKAIANQGGKLIISTDHGSIRVNRATQVIGDKDTTITIRYKEGKNLTCNPRHAVFVKNPKDYGLPTRNIIDNYIFTKDDYYFVYPNSYHQYQKQYNGTFQHGGISMEEMLLPIATCLPKIKK